MTKIAHKFQIIYERILLFLIDATVSDSLRDHNGSKFRTWDQKHSICPEKVGESWWFLEDCTIRSNLNGIYESKENGKIHWGKLDLDDPTRTPKTTKNENQTCRLQTARREADKTRNNERKGVMVKERVHMFPQTTLICFLNFSCISRNLRF